MTQEIGEPIRTKYTSCPSCGVFKVKDGWNYGEQICVCGFGKRPTEDEIENEQYLTAQVHNMLIDLIRLEQENARLEGNLREVLANERALIKQLQFERKSRSNKVLEASQRFVDARALLDCSRFYAKSHQNEEYANAERIALNELNAALESSRALD